MSFNANQILLDINYIIVSIKPHEFEVPDDIGISKFFPFQSTILLTLNRKSFYFIFLSMK